MNRRLKLLICTILFAVFLSGCATMKLIKADNANWKYSEFSSKLPVGWVKYSSPGTILSLTRDGQYLQNISIGKTKTGKDLPNTKRKITENLLLQELSRIIVDEISLTDGVRNFELISQKPADIDGLDAFRLEFKYANSDGVNYHGIIYGFIYKKKYYEIEYRAMEQHYDAVSIHVLDDFIRNFRVESG